jgi:hypothetical protein
LSDAALPQLVAALETVERSIAICEIAADRDTAQALKRRISAMNERIVACISRLESAAGTLAGAPSLTRRWLHAGCTLPSSGRQG